MPPCRHNILCQKLSSNLKTKEGFYKEGEGLGRRTGVVTSMHPLTPKSSRISWCIFLLFASFKVGVGMEKKETFRKRILFLREWSSPSLSSLKVPFYLIYVNMVV